MLSTAEWIEIVGEADDLASCLAAVRATNPDIVLLGVGTPGSDGVACLDRLGALERPVAVVIVTAVDERPFILEAIRHGAAGYVLTSASTAQVVATLRNVADGQLAVAPDLLRDALATKDAEPALTETPRDRAQDFAVTHREHDVLVLLADGLTNKEIGARLSITEGTVKKHVQNLIWKLRAADRTQAAILALRLGLIEIPD